MSREWQGSMSPNNAAIHVVTFADAIARLAVEKQKEVSAECGRGEK